MKATGIVRKVDPLGRIVLPKSLRTTLKMDVDDPVEVYMEGECIYLKRFEPVCTFCGSTGKLTAFKDKSICKKCLDAVKDGKKQKICDSIARQYVGFCLPGS